MTSHPSGAAATHPSLWPSRDDFDLAGLRRAGWSPAPLREFVVKVASRCNLHCDYCYVYELADQSWRGQPKRMTLETVGLLADRIREHAEQWGFPTATVSFHGGEPLLAGAAFIDDAATAIRTRVGSATSVRFVCQTNGTLVTPEIAAVLAKHRVRVGVSVDGDSVSNDRHRLYRDGSSSYADVRRGIELLRAAGPDTFAGLLATIDLKNDPLAVYQGLASLDTPHIDFLLPHGNWTAPPPGLVPGDGRAPYADWLLAIFDAWYDEPGHPRQIRIFEDVINLVVGGTHSFELFGLAPITLLTIETDGTIELVDTLKSAYEGAAATSLHLRDACLSDVLDHPGVVARQIGEQALHPTCRQCDLVRLCGGGMYTHRYSHLSGFRNPSVYCADLTKLITHIRSRVLDDVSAVIGAAR